MREFNTYSEPIARNEKRSSRLLGFFFAQKNVQVCAYPAHMRKH